MPGPRLERIRPCLHCGALMPFSALRCGACGKGVPGAPAPDERVRECLQCGVILRFDQDPCPQCGARTHEGADDSDRVKPCARCGELLPFAQLYCAKCGDLSFPIPVDAIPVEGDPDLDAAAPARLAGWVGGAAFAVGAASLLAAAVETLR
jgi:RNA polymerase subunit RPABC4/transcription elongation factor Spt4